MTELDQALVRRLAEWTPGDAPVTSLYLSVDGRRLPRKVDFELRLDEALRRVQGLAANLDKRARGSVEGDCAAILAFVRERFERGSTRGLALFSSSSNGLWEDVEIPRPVRNLADVGPSANVLQLEAILETYPTTCTALADHQHARLFLANLGRIEEISEVSDDASNRHDQGGLAQMRLQRHVDDHRQKHLKHVADELFRLQERLATSIASSSRARPMSSPSSNVKLHDYVAKRPRPNRPADDGVGQGVLGRSLALDEELEARQEREEADRLLDAVAARRGAVGRLDGVLDAVWETRAEAARRRRAAAFGVGLRHLRSARIDRRRLLRVPRPDRARARHRRDRRGRCAASGMSDRDHHAGRAARRGGWHRRLPSVLAANGGAWRRRSDSTSAARRSAGYRVGDDGRVRDRRTVTTPATDSTATVDAAIAVGKELATDEVRAVGIGAAGMVDHDDVVRYRRTCRTATCRSDVGSATPGPALRRRQRRQCRGVGSSGRAEQGRRGHAPRRSERASAVGSCRAGG